MSMMMRVTLKAKCKARGRTREIKFICVTRPTSQISSTVAAMHQVAAGHNRTRLCHVLVTYMVKIRNQCIALERVKIHDEMSKPVLCGTQPFGGSFELAQHLGLARKMVKVRHDERVDLG